ncbi:MAG: phospholipid carrier-dependent glycosyltransferase [Candidatus Altiarchaeota archaeon]|nr:phospholipid carrier-dependent glycosyltransferase [Candidatus Altiarchaeota archaeon]
MKKKRVRHLIILALVLILSFHISQLYSSLSTNDFIFGPPVSIFLKDTYPIYQFNKDDIKHMDELYWMQKTYIYYLFKERNFSLDAWDHPYIYDQPPLGRYILGFGLELLGGEVATTEGGLMLWEKSCMRRLWVNINERDYDSYGTDIRGLLEYEDYLRKGIRNSKISPLDLNYLLKAREIVFFFGLLTTLLVMLLCYILSRDTIASLVSGLLFLDNDISKLAFTAVLTETICAFFMLAILFTVFFYFRHKRQLREIIPPLLIGISIGFGISVKFTVFHMLVTTLLVFGIYLFITLNKGTDTHNKHHNKKIFMTFICHVFLIFSTSIAVFILLNPFLYSDPLGNTMAMIDHRVKYMELQWLHQQVPIDSTWDGFLNMYRRGILRDDTSGPFKNIGTLDLLYTFCVLVGLKELLVGSRIEIKQGSVGKATIAFVWALSTFLVFTVGVHMDWTRYYLSVIMVSATLFGIGLHKLIH